MADPVRSMLAAAALLWAAPVLAESPPACSPQEQPVVCMLKVQRNNAFDELAISEGKRVQESGEAERLANWWGQYVSGVNAQAEWWRRYADGVGKKGMSHAW